MSVDERHSRALHKSEWRAEQNKGDYKQEPGIDDLYKINMHLKKKFPDHEIMEVFGITSETLVAIKRNCYDPVDGISLDNQSKIYKEFERVNKKLHKIKLALKYLADNHLNEEHGMMIKKLLGMIVKNKESLKDDS